MAGGANCKNCGTPLELRYCPTCGQDAQDPPTGLLPLLRLFGAHLTGIEGVAIKTLRQLLLRPGRLTRAYVEGQRVRYASPFRLYLWCTAGFFLLHAYSPFVHLDPETGTVQSTLSVLHLETELSPATLSRIAARGMSISSFAPRFDAAVSAYLPVLLIALVLATALLMAAMFWRERAMTHAVFALHWSAFYFVLAALRRILLGLGSWGAVASGLGSVVALGYLAVAMRTAYRRSWPGSVLRAVLSLVLFGGLLTAWLLSTSRVAAALVAWGVL